MQNEMKAVALLLVAFPAMLLGAERWTVVTRLDVVRVPEGIALPALPSLIDPLTTREAWQAFEQEHRASIEEIGSVTASGVDQERCQAFTGLELSDRSGYKVPAFEPGPASPADAGDPGTFYPSTQLYPLEFGTRLECSGDVFPDVGLARIWFEATQSEPIGPVRFESGLLPTGLKLLFEKFEGKTRAAHGKIIIASGETRLVSIAKVQADPAKLELMFLSATFASAEDIDRPPREPLVDSSREATPGSDGAKLPVWQIPLDLVRIRLRQPAALQLRRRAEEATVDNSLREALALVAKREAELVDWQLISDGELSRCKVTNIRYRTAYRRYEPSDMHRPQVFNAAARQPQRRLKSLWRPCPRSSPRPIYSSRIRKVPPGKRK